MERSTEASWSAGPSGLKPALAPKPRLTPKPFSLQKSTAIRSISAPKKSAAPSKTTTRQTDGSEASRVPGPAGPPPAQKDPRLSPASDTRPRPGRALTKDLPKAARGSPLGEGALHSGVGKSDPASEPVQRDDVIQAPRDGEQKEDEPLAPVVQNLSGPERPPADEPASRRGGGRKRLSAKLTSRFESAGPTPPPRPTATGSTTGGGADRPESSDAEPSCTEPPGEERRGGGGIRRRIGLLLDSTSRPEPTSKREEPDAAAGPVKGVKERIQTWASGATPRGAGAERQPRVAPRSRSER
ncbi:hypothetical protein EYF80_056645 [Liparis tanakae]|uniref:Uncharacterized protein n=1 Tax=Liparis tanakae TaxID=230148 RepID=A0A4Z2EYB0_9TELE|nr:hypothetical protein EYF80_056645 [Liparis tanakae]